MSTFRFGATCFAIVVSASAAHVATAQDYPSRPIRIVTAAPGGGSDFTSRQIAQGISGPLGQPVIVDNRGPGFIAGEVLNKALPDGHTLLVNGGSTWITPLLQKAPYDVVRDFLPLSLLTREVNIAAVHPAVPVQSVRELVDLAKSRPGNLNYSLSGVGGPQHLGAELFKSMAGVNIVGVPYKGTVPAVTAAVSGEVQLTIADAGLVGPLAKSGKLKSLAVTSAEPSALAPGLPTVAASGIPGYEWVSLTGIWAPAKTSGAIISRLNQEIVRVLSRADVRERFFNAGADTVGTSPENFAAIIKSEIAKMSKVIKDAGIRAD